MSMNLFVTKSLAVLLTMSSIGFWLGRAFGGRDHTTVLHAVEKIEQDIAQDLHKKQTVEHLNQLVRSTPGKSP